MNKMAASSVESDYRILLVGKTGDGKSSTGNTIIGDAIFKEKESALSVTKICKWSKPYSRFGKTVEVVDTPGMYDTSLDKDTVHKELLKSLVLTSPGLHAIAFVLRRGTRFTNEVQKTKQLFFDWFGPGIEKYVCLLLTHTDTTSEMNEYIDKNNTHPDLYDLAKLCKDKIIPINNKGDQRLKDKQVKSLFSVLEEIKRKNRNEHFSNIVYRLADEYINNRRPDKLTRNSIRLLQTAGLHLQIDERQCWYYNTMFDVQEEESSSNERNEDNSGNEIIEAKDSRGIGNLTIIDDITNKRIPNTRKQQEMEVTPRRKYHDVHQSSSEEPSTENCSDQADEDYAVSGRRIEYKKMINEDESGDELRGFFGYMQRAWRWCKERTTGCTLQ